MSEATYGYSVQSRLLLILLSREGYHNNIYIVTTKPMMTHSSLLVVTLVGA